MRIEKTSENSIRCIIDSEELSYMNLNIDDMAYGTENAKILFDKALKVANDEFGFIVDNPLAVEAVPMKDGSMLLNITKVELPDELDTRFSKFSYARPKEVVPQVVPNFFQFLGGIFDTETDMPPQIFQGNVIEIQRTYIKKPKLYDNSRQKVFTFDSMDDVIESCKSINTRFLKSVESSLFKDETQKKYLLCIRLFSDIEDKVTNRKNFSIVCNTLSEYGNMVYANNYNIAYYYEHFKMILSNDAIFKLSLL